MAGLLSILVLSLGSLSSATLSKPSAPLMGWNSYNKYSCSPTEAIIKANAQGLITLGLDKLGYNYVTPDCGWNANYRDSSGQLVWDPTTFPSGGAALGEYIHGLGLKFGVYSGGGYYQCGSTNEPASLGYERTDAASFAAWGADALKYDNCYSASNTTMVDYTSAASTSPARYHTMANALSNVSRDTVYQICQWGVGTDIGEWASPIADSWRVSNDIQNNWASIWRITNEVVPYYKYTAAGAHPDMDMLIVGLGVLSFEEERFHFGMWALNKSPLVIGAPTNTTLTPAESISILSNAEVIAINQDSLGEQARLVRRYTEEGWDIWAGNLSNSRVVVGLANWNNASISVSVDLGAVLGISSAKARDIWAASDLGTVSGNYTTSLAGHQLKLIVLSSIVSSPLKATSTGFYNGTNATLSGAATIATCSAGECLPVGAKVSYIGQGVSAAAVKFSNVVAKNSGVNLLGVDFINYDVALANAVSNTNFYLFPLISVLSTLLSKRGDWYDTGRLLVEADGFVAGDANVVVFQAHTAGTYAPDLVGFEVFA